MLDLKALAENLVDLPIRRCRHLPEPSLEGRARSYTFRSVEDPECPPDPAVCDDAPFEANLRLGGALWSVAGRDDDGRVMDHLSRRIGRVTACARLTDTSFPLGLRQEFFARFDLPDGSYTAVGECALVSNDMPRAGVVLASCHLRVVEAPEGILGGVATSLSVFNPLCLPGFSTGSNWTLRVYERPAGR